MSAPPISAHGLSDDRGLTVIELVVAALVSIILLIGVLSMLDSGTRAERVTQARHDALLEGREAMGRLTKEVRQATSISEESSASHLDMETLLGGSPTPVRVRYLAEGTELRRAVCNPTCSFVTIARRLTSPDLFCYHYNLPDPETNSPGFCRDDQNPDEPITSIRVTLSIEPEVSAGLPVTLATDVQLRNL